MILPQFTSKQLRMVLIGVAVAMGIAVWAVGRYLSPAPPKSIAMSTGAVDGAYHAAALRYAKSLAAQGIEVKLNPSSGSVQNLARLNAAEASVALVQGGLGTASTDTEDDDDTTQLRTLSVVGYEPVWIFSRGVVGLEASLATLKGRRVAVGAEGSGSRKLALDLMASYGLTSQDVNLRLDTGMSAAKLLQAGELDAVIFAAAPTSAAVLALIGDPKVQLNSLAHANALPAKLAYLQTVSLKRGAIDPARNLPDRDIALLATTANLVVRDDLHPAVAYLLIEAARDAHRAPSPFSVRGEFPNLKGADFPVSDEAQRFFKEGRPFLQRYLPFWLANFVQRLILILVPLVAIMVPLFKVLPGLLDMRDKTRLYRRYGELMFIERDIATRQLTADEIAKTRKKLDSIAVEVSGMKFPLDFADKVYTLRQHVEFVRTQLDFEAKTA